MKNTGENRIQELLTKLRDKTISPDEYRELYSQIKNGDESGFLMKEHIHSWDLASKHSGQFNSEKKFFELRKKIETEDIKEGKYIQLQNNKSNVRTRLLQFAAIFVIGFAASWFLNKIVNKDNNFSSSISGLQENIISVKNGSRSRIQLPDGSIVHLNSGSELKYPPLFVNKKREVTLIGEAHFEVEADTSRPFIVKTPEITLRVTGTVFNVRAYEGDDDVQTTLISGSLDVFTNKKAFETKFNEENKITLKPNQSIVLKKDKGKNTNLFNNEKTNKVAVKKNPIIEKSVNTKLIAAWKDEKLIFNNEPFYELEKRFERWFNVKIEVKNEEIYSRRFTGTFEAETVEQVLNAMKLIIPFEYEIEKNKIIIKKSIILKQ